MTEDKLHLFSFLSTNTHGHINEKSPYLLRGIFIALVANIIFIILGLFIRDGLLILALLLFIPCLIAYRLIKIKRSETAIHIMALGYGIGFIGSPWLIGRTYAPIVIYISILLMANLIFQSRRVKILYFLVTFLSAYAYILANTMTTKPQLPCIGLIEFTMLLFSILFIVNALSIFIKDIDVYKQKIKEREIFLNKIINTSPNAIFVKNTKREFILVNDRFVEIEGRSKEVFIGKTAADIQGGFEADKVLEIEDNRILKQGETIADHIVTGKRNGEQIWFLYSKFPIMDEQKNIIGLLCVTKDISQQKRQEIALNEKNEKLQKYIESNMQLENFAHIASHDLREPIRSIVSFSQLLKINAKNKLNNDESDYLDFIITASQNMAAQIEDLLAYAIIETKKASFKSVNIARLIDDIIKQKQNEIKEKKAHISYKNMPDILNVNHTQFSQLFENLICNALMFSRFGTSPIIKINGEEYKQHWQFSVSDNGIGIEPEYYEKIFLLFRRLHTREVYQGTGIGLSICKKIVEQHKGKMWLESEVGQGTTFYFTIDKRLGQSIQIKGTK